MMGKKVPVTHTFEKKSDKEIVDVIEMAGPDGKLMKVSESTCKKK